MDAPKNFIVVSYGAIGDALMHIALMEQVHSAHPSMRLHLITARSGELAKELGGRYPYIEFTKLKSIEAFGRIAKLAFSRNVVLIPPSFGTVPVHIKMLGIELSRMPGSRLIGFSDKSTWFPYTTTHPYESEVAYFETLREAVKDAGIQISSEPPSYEAEPNAHLLERLQLSPGGYIVIHPFAANKKRELPPRRIKAIIERMHGAFPDLAILVTGAKPDAEIAFEVAGTQAHSLAGTLTLPETAVVVKDAALYVGIDTGITHLASLMRVPSVVVGNRSNPSWLPSYSPKTHILTEPMNCRCTGDKGSACAVEEDGREYFRCAYDVTDAALDAAIAEVVSARG